MELIYLVIADLEVSVVLEVGPFVEVLQWSGLSFADLMQFFPRQFLAKLDRSRWYYSACLLVCLICNPGFLSKVNCGSAPEWGSAVVSSWLQCVEVSESCRMMCLAGVCHVVLGFRCDGVYCSGIGCKELWEFGQHLTIKSLQSHIHATPSRTSNVVLDGDSWDLCSLV